MFCCGLCGSFHVTPPLPCPSWITELFSDLDRSLKTLCAALLFFLHASFITTALLRDNNNVPAAFPGTSLYWFPYSNIHSRLSTLPPLHAQLIMITPSLPFSLLSSLVSFPSCLLPPSSWLPNTPSLASSLSHYPVVLSGFLSHDAGATTK